MLASAASTATLEASRIPYVTAVEAHALLRTELERLLALAESLDPVDWAKPTACALWTVRDMLAHQAGGYASGTGYGELIHQYVSIPRPGQLLEDAINARQLAERAGKLPAELIDELRRVGPIAIDKWAHQFRALKLLGVPHPVVGQLTMRHLMWVIHSRDTWMHRLDICRATGRNFVQTLGHDDRIAALVMLDVAKALTRKLGGRAIEIELTGVAGGVWKFGTGQIEAALRMDTLDFNIVASGRYTYGEARSKATLGGDIDLAELALKKAVALY